MSQTLVSGNLNKLAIETPDGLEALKSFHSQDPDILSPKSYLNYAAKTVAKNNGTQSITDLAKSPYVELKKQDALVNKA